MKPVGKVLIATALLGTTVGCVVLGSLYNSCIGSHGSAYQDLDLLKKQKEEVDAKVKGLEEKEAAVIKERDEAKEKEAAAIKERDEAKAELAKFKDSEVDLKPCQGTEVNFDYKQQLEIARAEHLEVSDELEQLREQFTILKAANDKLTQDTNQTLVMAADMADQYNKEKAKWDAEKADYEAKLTDTVNYYLNKSDDCQWHYNSQDKRYGKVCYDNGGKVKREIWMAGDDNSEIVKLLKEQFDKAPDGFSFIDGVEVKKKNQDGQTRSLT